MTNDKTYWIEIFRILEVARTHSGDELLEKCLNGREMTAQSVSKLFKLARLHFRSREVNDRICEACLPFLEANLSFEELQKLKNPEPANGNILEEMAEEGRS